MKPSVIAFFFAITLAIGCQQSETANGPTQSDTTQEVLSDDAPLLSEDTPLLLEDPPLLLDDTPLLLDDTPLFLEDEGDASAAPTADNSRCHHCHLNYMDEDIALIHAKANMGCADCHGASDAHIADESWADGGNGTAPDIMYPREKINPFCLSCHEKSTITKDQHEDLFADTSDKKYCTDCHGDHRLPKRICKWK